MNTKQINCQKLIFQNCKTDFMKKKTIYQLKEIEFLSVEYEVQDCDLEIGVKAKKELSIQ